MPRTVPHRTTLIAGALLVAGLVAVACGTTDQASRETLPPIVTTTSSTSPPTSTPDEDGRQRAYEIKSGDTLASIARSFAVPMQSIIDLNGISNPDAIAVGDTILIPTDIVLIEDLPDPPPTTPAP